MGRATILMGKADTKAPSWSSAEHAAQEFFFNRVTAGVFAPRPPIERW